MEKNDIIIDGYPVRIAVNSTGRRYRNNSKLLKRLLEDYKNCYWCGIEVFYWGHHPHERAPDDSATIDHLVSRFHRKRGEVSPKVIACYRCNAKRAKAEEKEIFGKVKNHENSL